jgi:hypothetical protein
LRHLRSVAIVALLLGMGVRVQARVTKITIEEQAAGSEARHNVPDIYRVFRGQVIGELDPLDPHNRIVQDIALAQRNVQGNVEYTATFTLYAPIHPAANAALLYEVVNRGASLMPREYSNGDFFLQSGWQADIPFGGPAISGAHGETVHVPIAKDATGATISGPALTRFFDLPAGTTTLALARSKTYYQSGVPPEPLSLDTSAAHLVTKRYEDIDGATSGVSEIPANDWAWGDCTSSPFPGVADSTKICLKHVADPTLLYELRYTAKNPLVLGAGLAAMRDVASFFRYARKDDYGTPNPIPQSTQHAIVIGISQSGNLIRTFLNLGFNQDENNRQVFDGAFPIIAARQVPVNVRFGVPGGTSMLYEIGTDGVDWWSSAQDTNRNHPVGALLDRCTASHSCPKIVELLGSTEFWTLRASLGFTGTSADRDIPLPANVRRYYIASTQHGGGSGVIHWSVLSRQHSGECASPLNPNPMDPTRRALLLALKQWVIEGVEPPPSSYPRLSDGTLLPSTSVIGSFPLIPGAPLPHEAMNPAVNYDLGPDFSYNDLTGTTSQQPPAVIGESKIALPAVDADGNEIGGIHTPLRQVPLGTYLGWNIVSTGFRKGQFCGLSGSYIPFPRTPSDRKLTRDPRLSLEERYGTHKQYVDRVKAAAEDLVKQRFLLPDDARKTIEDANGSDALR